MKNYRKYKQLVKQLVFEKSDFEYAQSISDEIGFEFAEMQLKYLADNNITLDLRPGSNVPSPPPPVDSKGLVSVKKESESNIKHFAKIYKLIARKIHPDKFSNVPRTEDIIEKEEMFKAAVTAYKSADWATFLEIAEKLNIRPIKLPILLSEIPKEIDKLRQKTNKIKNTWGWQLYDCNDDEECKDRVLRSAMKRIYNV